MVKGYLQLQVGIAAEFGPVELEARGRFPDAPHRQESVAVTLIASALRFSLPLDNHSRLAYGIALVGIAAGNIASLKCAKMMA